VNGLFFDLHPSLNLTLILGAGNHYTEVQVVEKIYDKNAAKKMGIEFENQVCIFVHSGSRGLGKDLEFFTFWTILTHLFVPRASSCHRFPHFHGGCHGA
jgi:hypothetical protein